MRNIVQEFAKVADPNASEDKLLGQAEELIEARSIFGFEKVMTAQELVESLLEKA